MAVLHLAKKTYWKLVYWRVRNPKGKINLPRVPKKHKDFAKLSQKDFLEYVPKKKKFTARKRKKYNGKN